MYWRWGERRPPEERRRTEAGGGTGDVVVGCDRPVAVMSEGKMMNRGLR